MNVTRYHEILRGMGYTPVDAEKCGCGSCKVAGGCQESATTVPEPLMARVAAFRAQLAAWVASGRCAVPLLVLPDAPAPQEGRCWSCGDPVASGRWRCAPCLEAVELVLKEPA